MLHARFEMATVDVGRNASSSLRQAAELGTVVELAEQDHEAAMEELKRRAELAVRRARRERLVDGYRAVSWGMLARCVHCNDLAALGVK